MELSNIIKATKLFELEPKTTMEVWEGLKELRTMRAQCSLWFNRAKEDEELPTMFLLETEIQYLMALEAGVRWALGLGQTKLVHPSRIAIYNQRRDEDGVEITEERADEA